jgi:hypothetical protein
MGGRFKEAVLGDAWLIAHALCDGGTVVTEETRGMKLS